MPMTRPSSASRAAACCSGVRYSVWPVVAERLEHAPDGATRQRLGIEGLVVDEALAEDVEGLVDEGIVEARGRVLRRPRSGSAWPRATAGQATRARSSVSVAPTRARKGAMVADMMGQSAAMCSRPTRSWTVPLSDRGQVFPGVARNSWTSRLRRGPPAPYLLVSPEGPSKRSRRGWSASRSGSGTRVPPGLSIRLGDRANAPSSCQPGGTRRHTVAVRSVTRRPVARQWRRDR